MLEYRFGQYGAIGYGGFLVDSRFKADMALVGSRLSPTDSKCGVFSRVKGCLNHKGHVGLGLPDGVYGSVRLDGSIGYGKAVVFPRAYHCKDPLCVVCCYDFARRAARKALAKFEIFSEIMVGYQVFHVVVSVPELDYGMSFEFMKRQADAALQMAGIDGGIVMFHPKRYDDESKIWYFAPHFHCVGFLLDGWFEGQVVSVINNLTGYVVKFLDERKSVLGTLLYQLSHAGVVGGHKHSLWWIGCMGSRAAKRSGVTELVRANERAEAKLRDACPVCGGRMVHLCRCKTDIVFDYLRYEEEFVLDDVDNWVEVKLPFGHSKRVVVDDDRWNDDYEAFAGMSDM